MRWLKRRADGSPLVSVLLPTHNRADVIGYAIDSVLCQTEQDFELLIVGDGCTDNTAEVVARYRDKRIHWFDLPKAPYSGYANRNHVLRLARGRYVAYAQHDDIFFEDHLQRLIATIESSPADWCYSRPLWCTPDGYCIPFSVNLQNADELEHFLTTENHIPSCSVLHTREALERVGYWPEDRPRTSDWVCWGRMIRSSRSGAAAYCPTATVLHFRAIWKTPEQEVAVVKRLHAMAREAEWWPAALKFEVSAGETEQSAFVNNVCAGRMAHQAHIAAMRAGVDVVLDRLAWQVATAEVTKSAEPQLE